MSENQSKVAGRIAKYVPYWKNLTSDRFILESVQGYRIEFYDDLPPSQFYTPRNIKFSRSEQEVIDQEIKKLLDKGVLVLTEHEEDEYINTIFTRPKKDGGTRMILNMKPLNQNVQYHKFKMDTLKSVLKLVKKNCYMASVDIRDAYYSVKIKKDNQKYLKFFWRDKLYAYAALPNGLSSAPRLFTKIMKPIFSNLRLRGHIVAGYIDDIYIQADSLQDCSKAVQDTCDLLQNCGFLIHDTKSVFQGAKEITFLGFVINSENMTVRLTEEKKQKYIALCSWLKNKQVATIRDVASVIGTLVSSFDGVQYGPLHYRLLESCKTEALSMNKGDYDAKMAITVEMKQELSWWIQNLENSFNFIERGNPDVVVQTDATKEAWGACCNGQKASGFFSVQEKSQFNDNINAFEALAIKFALQAFEKELINKHVLIKADNITAVAHIAHMGGSKSQHCNNLVQQIWDWCIHRNIWLSSQFLPGIENVSADYESRNPNERTEWSLKKSVFEKITQILGKPSVDMFASRLNFKIEKFVSWKSEPLAIATDAFSMNWSNELCYIFPPFSLLNRIAQKIRQDQAEALMIVPFWPTQIWFVPLMSMLVDLPLLLPLQKDLLQLPHKPQEVHPLYPKLKMIACRLSGNPMKQNKFLQELPVSSWPHGGHLQRNSIRSISTDGLSFVIKNRSVKIRRM